MCGGGEGLALGKRMGTGGILGGGEMGQRWVARAPARSPPSPHAPVPYALAHTKFIYLKENIKILYENSTGLRINLEGNLTTLSAHFNYGRYG